MRIYTTVTDRDLVKDVQTYLADLESDFMKIKLQVGFYLGGDDSYG